MMIKITCPACGEVYPADQREDTAICPHCGKLVFTHDPQAEDKDYQRKRKRKLYDTPPPERFNIVEVGDKLQISWRWISWNTALIALVAVIWHVILFAYLLPALSVDTNSFLIVFTVIHIAMGISFIYAVLTQLFNTTTITVDRNHIHVHTSPLPIWHGNKQFDANHIEQIFVRQHISRTQNKTTFSYTVWVVEYGTDKPQRLLHKLYNAEYALYLEHEIEEYLGIADRRITGAYKR